MRAVFATAALKEIWKRTRHEPRQLLRLVVDAKANIAFSLDAARPGDRVLTHEGTQFLLIETPVPTSLVGSKLDIIESAGCTRQDEFSLEY